MQNDGFVRVWVIHQGKRTSISLDDVLFDALAQREGSPEAATLWLRAQVAEVEARKAAEDPTVTVHKAGLSRLVQRLVLHHVLAQSSPAARAGVKPH